MKIRRTNTNVNNKNLNHDQNDISFQFQDKIAKVISTGLEGIFCFVYHDVSRRCGEGPCTRSAEVHCQEEQPVPEGEHLSMTPCADKV